jgi:hypothetical protein
LFGNHGLNQPAPSLFESVIAHDLPPFILSSLSRLGFRHPIAHEPRLQVFGQDVNACDGQAAASVQKLIERGSVQPGSPRDPVLRLAGIAERGTELIHKRF